MGSYKTEAVIHGCNGSDEQMQLFDKNSSRQIFQESIPNFLLSTVPINLREGRVYQVYGVLDGEKTGKVVLFVVIVIVLSMGGRPTSSYFAILLLLWLCPACINLYPIAAGLPLIF